MLSQDARKSLEHLGLALKKELTKLLERFPASAQSIAGMSRWLGFNRSNCQRLLNAINNSENGIDTLCMLPGVAGLNELINLCREKDIPETELKKISAEIEKFDIAIAQHARSHSELKRLLKGESQTQAQLAEPSQENARRIQYEAIAELIGESTDLLYGIYILSDRDHGQEYLNEYALVSKQGVRHRQGARPFFQYYSHQNVEGFEKPALIQNANLANNRQFLVGIVDEFSSENLWQAYTEYSEAFSCMVFGKMDSLPQPFDATFIFANPDEVKNPLTSETRSSSTAISIKNPTKRLIMTVFMQRSLDKRSTVKVGCYSANHAIPEGQLKADDIWTDRLPEFPELRILDVDSPSAQRVDDISIGELNDYLFACAGLDKSDFVCYLLDVPYPIWSTCYRIFFEHG